MSLVENRIKRVSLLVMAILLVSFLFTTVSSTISSTSKLNLVVLATNQEPADSEKDFNEDPFTQFFVDIQNPKFHKEAIKKTNRTVCFLLPPVFYDVQLLPPEVQVS